MIRTSLAMIIAGFFLRSNAALAQIPHSVALTWEVSATSNVYYNIYRSNTSGGYSATPLASVSATSYIDYTVQAGQTYFYVVKAVDFTNPSNLSLPSNEALAAIPTSSGLSHANLIWQQDGTSVPGVWFMGGTDGSTLLSSEILSGPQPGWRIVAAADLNSDGHPDLIWQQDGTNVPGVWYMGGTDGSTLLSSEVLSGPQPGWRIVAAADLNSDGHPDLIWQQDGTNVPGVWYMGGTDGSTVVGTKYLSGPQPGWRIVGPK